MPLHTYRYSYALIKLYLSFFSDIYGGHLLGVKSVSGLAFFDWESTDLVRRIEIQPKSVSCLIQTTNHTNSVKAKYAHCITAFK